MRRLRQASLGFVLAAALLVVTLGSPARATDDLVVVFDGQAVLGPTPAWFHGELTNVSSPGCSPTSCVDYPLDLTVPEGYWDTVHGGVEMTIQAHTSRAQDVIGAEIQLLSPDGSVFATSKTAWADSVLIARGMTSGHYTLRVNATASAVTFDGLVQREVRPQRPATELLPDLTVLPIGSISSAWSSSKLPLSCRPLEMTEQPTPLRCLRFNTSIGNYGPGRLYLTISNTNAITGIPTAVLGEALVPTNFTQMIERTDYGADPIVVGSAIYHVGHNHYHYRSFVYNRLYAFDNATKQRGALVVEGKKEGFCPDDSGLIALALPDTEEPATSACKVAGDGSDIVLRIDSNYYDTYTADIDDQYVDITNVPPGLYELVTTVNLEGSIRETNYADNTRGVLVQITATDAKQVPGDAP